MRLPLGALNLVGMHIFHQSPSLLVLTSPMHGGMEGSVNLWSAAQLGLVTYHTMEQCWQDGHPIHVLTVNTRSKISGYIGLTKPM